MHGSTRFWVLLVGLNKSISKSIPDKLSMGSKLSLKFLMDLILTIKSKKLSRVQVISLYCHLMLKSQHTNLAKSSWPQCCLLGRAVFPHLSKSKIEPIWHRTENELGFCTGDWGFRDEIRKLGRKLGLNNCLDLTSRHTICSFSHRKDLQVANHMHSSNFSKNYSLIKMKS